MNYEQWFMTLYRRQGSRPSPWKRNAKRQNGCLRRPYKLKKKKKEEEEEEEEEEEKQKAKEKKKDISI